MRCLIHVAGGAFPRWKTKTVEKFPPPRLPFLRVPRVKVYITTLQVGSLQFRWKGCQRLAGGRKPQGLPEIS